MAAFAVTNTYLLLSANDLMDHITDVNFSVEGAVLDKTNMASAGWVELLQGLKQGTLDVTFLGDWATSETGLSLWSYWNTGTAIAFETRPTQSAVGANNPKWTGSVLPKDFKPISGKVGDLATTTISWPTTGAVAFATS